MRVALARLHRSLYAGEPVTLLLSPPPPAAAAGRWVEDVVTGAGFELAAAPVAVAAGVVRAAAVRARTLPDYVGPGLRLICCGLNPSLVAADAGFGFAGASNRFWPAALQAGLVTVARDPLHALLVDGVGMTDFVKRATPRAAALDRAEYSAGAARVGRLVAELAPAALCVVGLDGWRAAIDRRARPGWQPGGLGGRPAYVMPSTSGLNARTSLRELTEHLRRALAGPDPAG